MVGTRWHAARRKRDDTMRSIPDPSSLAYAVLRKNGRNCAVQLGTPAPGGLHLESIRERGDIEAWCARISQYRCGAALAGKGGHAIQDHPRLVTSLPGLACRATGQSTASGNWRRNPAVLLTAPGVVPDDINRAFVGFDLSVVFDLNGTGAVLWVRDPCYGLWWPYRVDEDGARLIRDTPLDQYDDASRTVLGSIGFLVAYQPHQRVAASPQRAFWRMDGFLNPLQRRALAAYFADLVKSGMLKKGDYQTPDRYWAHNDAISRFIQLQTLDAVRRVTGIAWEPTFTSFLAYEDQAELTCHTDREQAALTLSLLIDYHIGVATADDEWPIYIEQPRSPGAFEMTHIGLGNAIAFQGGQSKHYRERIPEHHASRSLCFHYAQPGFPGKRF
jgi:hypothetical protein